MNLDRYLSAYFFESPAKQYFVKSALIELLIKSKNRTLGAIPVLNRLYVTGRGRYAISFPPQQSHIPVNRTVESSEGRAQNVPHSADKW